GEEPSAWPISVVNHASSDGRRRDRRKIRSYPRLPGETELAVDVHRKGHHAVLKLIRIRVRRVANVEEMRRVRPRRNAVELPVVDARDLQPLGGAHRDITTFIGNQNARLILRRDHGSAAGWLIENGSCPKVHVATC